MNESWPTLYDSQFKWHFCALRLLYKTPDLESYDYFLLTVQLNVMAVNRMTMINHWHRDYFSSHNYHGAIQFTAIYTLCIWICFDCKWAAFFSAATLSEFHFSKCHHRLWSTITHFRFFLVDAKWHIIPIVQFVRVIITVMEAVRQWSGYC